MRRAAWFCLMATLLGGSAAAHTAPDPYAALQVYDGVWRVRSGPDGAPQRTENHCARSGMFFRCEQMVGGSTVALVFFMPLGAPRDGKQSYRTQVMGAPSDAPGGWNLLTINGRSWVFEPEDAAADAPERDRTACVFLDDDHIHFEVQHSTAGGAWITKARGDEERVR
jgi:hypothetical protein